MGFGMLSSKSGSRDKWQPKRRCGKSKCLRGLTIQTLYEGSGGNNNSRASRRPKPKIKLESVVHEDEHEHEERGRRRGLETNNWSDGVVFADDSLSKSGQVYFEESSENPISTKGTKTLISSNTSCTNSNSNSNSNSNHNNKNRPIPFSTLQIPKPIPINTTNTPFTRHGISSPSSKNYHHYSSSQPLNIVYPKSLPSENHLLTNNPSLSISMSRSFAKTYLVDIPKPSIPLPKERPVLFVQMQLCESTLHEYLLHRNKSLDFPIDNSVNLALFKDICLGVEAIHKANLIHRDLKPANVFLNLIGDPCSFCSASPYPPLFSSYSASCPNNCSKILPLIGDFGLVSTSDISPDDPLSLSLSLSPSPSTPIPPPNSHSHSHRSRCLSESIIPPDFSPKPLHHPLTPPSFASPRTSGIGTVTYAAPEQLADPSSSSSYGYKADIYSLGIIFFELFYKFNTLMERHLVLKNLRSAIFPADFESTWPAHAEFVRWLMNKSPSLRPSASEILSSPLFASLSSPSSSSSSSSSSSTTTTTTNTTTTTTTKSTTKNTNNTNINTNASSCSDSHNSSSTISSSLLNDPCPDLSELQLQLDQKNKHISFLNNKISLLEKLLSNK
ncbi:Eukaryotic translation initiation factor 2-alpha kinase 3 [Zancudomyces culisetae]|uniref:non-specific serine/threonine protein kinase n=1 Tax=Zancudomyces culisetae TaxID=1213189 RepID=A0A1R1PN67_ZANCU|nr:Eukaryotic translation initiation factor 2-alpha kinase 3 [Zancudomyces culisetae]|eukprot:OMH82404.1 Eukaryotic translation initiation factor 2-alpha kinase 3 [Zancudomyces culisetae]